MCVSLLAISLQAGPRRAWRDGTIRQASAEEAYLRIEAADDRVIATRVLDSDNKTIRNWRNAFGQIRREGQKRLRSLTPKDVSRNSD